MVHTDKIDNSVDTNNNSKNDGYETGSNESDGTFDIKCNKFPFEIVDVDPDVNQQLLMHFRGERDGFVQVGPKKYFFPSGYRREAENYYNFPVRPNDVWIVTFPRSGTTWTQEMVWLLANNLDFETAAKIPLAQRFPFFEYSAFLHPTLISEFCEENAQDSNKLQQIEEIITPAYRTLSKQTTRRFIKTHLPFSLLPPNLIASGCKVIYVARNPKDVAVSFYHLNRLCRTQGYRGDFPTYWNYFRRNLQPWTPYWEHLKEALNLRQSNRDNFLFLFYEDMKNDTRSIIEKTSKFLLDGRNNVYTSDGINKLLQHLEIENFRQNKSVNFEELRDLGVTRQDEPSGFIRIGRTGGWRRYFVGGDLEADADRWIDAHVKQLNITFPY